MIKKLLLTLTLGVAMISSAYAGTVTLAWDASPSLDVNRYKIYGVQGTNIVFLTNNSNATLVLTLTNHLSVVIPGLVNGKAYTFAATALSTNNLESVNSSTVWTYIPYVTPSSPVNLRFTDVTP